MNVSKMKALGNVFTKRVKTSRSVHSAFIEQKASFGVGALVYTAAYFMLLGTLKIMEIDAASSNAEINPNSKE